TQVINSDKRRKHEAGRDEDEA
ncbi:ribosome-binding factor A, partial [Vibrio parahaemolyticus]|nr:ribosome-binding factor A [Vibrio parahaemolyticus]